MLKYGLKVRLGSLVLATLLLSACNTTDGGLSSWGNKSPGPDLPATVQAYPDDEVLGVAKAQFAAGNFGHAARYYERVVEVTPNNGEGWLGLAAAYDRIRRFDLADRAYRQAAQYVGGTAEFYNNVGYSYLLRGDVLKARGSFLQAHELDPTNPTINNNLAMLTENISRPRRS